MCKLTKERVSVELHDPPPEPHRHLLSGVCPLRLASYGDQSVNDRDSEAPPLLSATLSKSWF